MVIGILKCNQENLVALVPQVISKLNKDQIQVVFEPGAGADSGYLDTEFETAGAKKISRKEVLQKSDVLLTVSGLIINEIALIREETLVVGKFDARKESKLLHALRKSKLKVFSLDLLPRTTIAQSMDVLSSLASLSGYKAVITAAENYAGYFSMMTTSAGIIPPAKVLIIGAGVAGLQAIATARRLGAVVEAFDVRSSVKEEVESLGGKFIEVSGSKENKGDGGYAIQQSGEFIRKQQELIYERAIKADIIISTAIIPGKKAPVLIEEKTVADMKPCSVIVDLAAASGGNCAFTKNDTILAINGVKIIGDSKLYNRMGKQASLVFSNNLYNFLKHILQNGIDNIPYDDEIVSKTLLRVNEGVAISA